MAKQTYRTNWQFRHDGKVYEPDTILPLDPEAATPLLGGVLSEVVTPTEAASDGQLTDEELAELGVEVRGGGYYTLPNGEKVRGRDAVLAYLESLNDEGEPGSEMPPEGEPSADHGTNPSETSQAAASEPGNVAPQAAEPASDATAPVGPGTQE